MKNQPHHSPVGQGRGIASRVRVRVVAYAVIMAATCVSLWIFLGLLTNEIQRDSFIAVYAIAGNLLAMLVSVVVYESGRKHDR